MSFTKKPATWLPPWIRVSSTGAQSRPESGVGAASWGSSFSWKGTMPSSGRGACASSGVGLGLGGAPAGAASSPSPAAKSSAWAPWALAQSPTRRAPHHRHSAAQPSITARLANCRSFGANFLPPFLGFCPPGGGFKKN